MELTKITYSVVKSHGTKLELELSANVTVHWETFLGATLLIYYELKEKGVTKTGLGK